MLSKKFFLMVFLPGITLAMAKTPTPAAQSAAVPMPTVPTAVSQAKPAVPTLYCPSPDQLQKKGMRWYVGKKWQSYDRSFVNKIKSFAGVQWVGVRVGNVICLYQGVENVTFPVAIEPAQPVLVPEPTATNWFKVQGKPGYRQCLSRDVKDCPFTQQQTKPGGDLYQQIRYQGPNSDIAS